MDELVREAIGDVGPDLAAAYRLLLGVSSHDLSVMRELLGVPERVLHASARHAGGYLTAAFDYGAYVCQFETGIDDIPRFDCHIEVYSDDRVVYSVNRPSRQPESANGQNGTYDFRRLFGRRPANVASLTGAVVAAVLLCL